MRVSSDISVDTDASFARGKAGDFAREVQRSFSDETRDSSDATFRTVAEMMVRMAPLEGNPVAAASTFSIERLFRHVAVAQGLIGALTADRQPTVDEVERLGGLANVFLAYVTTDLAAMTHLTQSVVGTVQGNTLQKMVDLCQSDISSDQAERPN